MTFISSLRAPALNSVLAAGFGILGTIVVVWMAGPETFAHYAIDLAKLTLVGLILEVIPSAYAIYHVQRDAEFRSALGAFSAMAAIALILAVLGLAMAGAFSSFSLWILAYVAFLPVQRYVDISLQADGQVAKYFFLVMTVNATRLLLLPCGLLLWPASPTDVVWASIAVASWVSIVAIYASDSRLRGAVSHRGHSRPFGILWKARRSYYGYYLNAALKRIKDSLMMLICGTLVSNTTVVTQYVLIVRGIDFVCGQFRITEAALTNYENRRKVAHSRGRDLAVMAVLGQGVAIVLSAVLALQAGPLNWQLFGAIAVASFIIYPYVVEITLRSDAYAAFRPRRVTLSIAAYLVTIVAVTLTWLPFGLDLTVLVVAQVAAQFATAAVYLLIRSLGSEGTKRG